jgi:hypothetical protein
MKELHDDHLGIDARDFMDILDAMTYNTATKEVMPRPIAHISSFGEYHGEASNDPAECSELEWINPFDSLAGREWDCQTSQDHEKSKEDNQNNISSTSDRDRILGDDPGVHILPVFRIFVENLLSTMLSGRVETMIQFL